MKKLLALVLSLAMVLSFGLAVLAEGEEAPEEPSYLWIKATDSAAAGFAFKVDTSVLKDTTYLIRARVKFGEDVVIAPAGGCAFLNVYSYDDPDSHNDFAHLIGMQDYATNASANVVLGQWADVEAEFNPFDVTYANGTAVKKDNGKATPLLLTLGMGFYNATGTISVASISFAQKDGGQVVWSKVFDSDLNLEDTDMIVSGATAENKGQLWDTVYPAIEVGGNLAYGADMQVVGSTKEGKPEDVGQGVYKAKLNDGQALDQSAYDARWFGFYVNNESPDNNSVTGATLGDQTGNLGTLIVDLGSAKKWDKVRSNIWAPGASGIGAPLLIKVSYSDDKTTWTELGDLTLGTDIVYWAELEADEAVTSRYLKIEYLWTAGVFCMVNEVEVLAAAGEVVDPADPATPVDPADPADPATGDAGLIALAVIAVIALGGATVISKRK